MLFRFLERNFDCFQHGVRKLWLFRSRQQFSQYNCFQPAANYFNYQLPFSPYSFRCFSSSFHPGLKPTEKNLLHDLDINDNENVLLDLKSLSSEVIDFSLIRKATTKTLNPKDASFLISLCAKKTVNANPQKRVDQAEQIFDASKTQTIQLFNKLLDVYIQNEIDFDSSDIYSRLKKLSLRPNKRTHISLITGLCLKGDVSDAVNIAKKSKVKLLNNAYGPMAYGLCIKGNPEEAVKLVEKAMVDKFSGETLTWLLSGLAKSDSLDLFHSTIEKYSSDIKNELSLSDALKVYDKLCTQSNYVNIQKLTIHLSISKDDILYATRSLQDLPLHQSAYFIDCLLENFHDTFSYDETEPLKLIFESHLPNRSSLTEVLLEIQKLKKFYPLDQFLEYYFLSLIFEKQPWLIKEYLKKLKKKNFFFIYPLPSHLSSTIQLPEKFGNFFSKLNFVFENEKQVWDVLQNLKAALFDNAEQSFRNIFSSTSADVFDHQENKASFSALPSSNLVLNAFALFFEGYGNKSLKLFKTIMNDLFNAGFKLTKDDLEYLRLLIKPQDAFFFDQVFSNDSTAKGLLEICEHKRCNLKPEVLKKHADMNEFQLSDDESLQIQSVIDTAIDDNEAFGIDTLKYVANRYNRDQSSVTKLISFLFYQHLISGRLHLAEEILTNFENSLIDLKIRNIPTSILKNKDVSVNSFLLRFLKKLNGNENAIWIYFLSFLKADMPNIAFKLLQNNLKTVSNQNCDDFLTALNDKEEFPMFVTKFFQQCRNLDDFEQDSFYLGAVRLLLQNDRFKEAQYLLSAEKFYEKKDTNKALISMYFQHQYPIPFYLKNEALQNLSQINDQKNPSRKHFMMCLKNMFLQKKSFLYHAVASEIINFYKKSPASDYESLTNKMEKIFPAFKPSFQSQILLNQIEKLCSEKAFDEALEFANKNLKECTQVTENVWIAAVELIGNLALANGNLNQFQQLCDICTRANPRIHALISSYIIYFHLKSDETQLNKQEILSKLSVPNISDLIRLMSSNSNPMAFNKLLEITESLFDSRPELLKHVYAASVLQNFQTDKLISLMQDKKSYIDASFLLDTARLCYSSSDQLPKLINVDRFYRSVVGSQADMHCILNHLLLQEFASLIKDSSLDETVIDYITEKYHIIPSRENTVLAQMHYLDMLTNVKFGNFDNCAPV